MATPFNNNRPGGMNPYSNAMNGSWNNGYRGEYSPSGNPNSSNTNSYVPNRLVSADPTFDGPFCGDENKPTVISVPTYTKATSNCSCPAGQVQKSKPEWVVNGQQGFKFYCGSRD
jgi:hypothetical protein